MPAEAKSITSSFLKNVIVQLNNPIQSPALRKYNDWLKINEDGLFVNKPPPIIPRIMGKQYEPIPNIFFINK